MVKNDEAFRKKLGLELREMIDAGIDARSSLEGRWDQIDRAYYKGRIESLKPPWPDAPKQEYPIHKSKTDSVQSYLAGSLTKNAPYFIVRAGGPGSQRIDDVQTALHTMLRTASYEKMVRESLNITLRRGICFVRCGFVESIERPSVLDKVKGALLRLLKSGPPARKLRTPARLKFDVIPPEFHVHYPAYAWDPADQLIEGHQYTMRQEEVDRRQKTGEFYKDRDKKVQSTNDQYQPGRETPPIETQQTNDNSTRIEDRPVKIFDVLRFRLDEDDPSAIYRITFAYDSSLVLKFDRFHCHESWYKRVYLHTEPNRLYPETSRGYDLVAVHKFEQDLRDLIIWGGIMNEFPTTFTNSALDDDMTQAAPGKVISLERGAVVSQLQSHSDTSAFTQLLGVAQEDGDRIARVSSMGQGSNMRSGTTATEAAQIAQGQATGVSDDAQTFGEGLNEIARFCCNELLFWNFNEWYQDYRDVLGPMMAADFAIPWWFEVNGETPVNTPAAIMQQATQLLGVIGPAIQAEGAMMQLAAQAQIQYKPILPTFNNLIAGLLKAVIQQSQLTNKERITPQDEAINSDEANQGAGIETVAKQLMGMGATSPGGQIGGGEGQPPDAGAGPAPEPSAIRGTEGVLSATQGAMQ